jgi:hypothetical protein
VIYWKAMKRAITLLILVLPLCAQVKFTQTPGKIEVLIDGKPFATYVSGGDSPKPYLAPMRTADGAVITRRFPMESVAGETKDHPHHRGLWFTHGDINQVDFWMNEPGAKGKHGSIVLNKPEKLKGGKKEGTITASYSWKLDDNTVALREDRVMTFVADPQLRIVDFDVTFTAQQPVVLGDTKEGFFALRLRDELAERKGTGTITSAEGKTGMKQVWGKKSPWVDYAGTLEGKKVGVTIMDHPGNPRHPTYWHVRDYGLFAANAFGVHDFLNDRSQNGSLTLKESQQLRFRYRVVIHPGATNEVDAAGWFAAWGNSAK